MIRPNYFIVGRDLPEDNPLIVTSKLQSVDEKILGLIPRPLDTVKAGRTIIINGKLLTNATEGNLTVPDPLDYEDALLAGFDSFIGSGDKSRVPPGNVVYLLDTLWVNTSNDILSVPDPLTEGALMSAGFTSQVNIEGVNEEQEFNANSGDTIPAGETRFINGRSYSNVGDVDLVVPEDTSEENLLVLGLKREGESGSQSFTQTTVDNIFLPD